GKACDFSKAYVIAHEVGHHVQNLLGILPKVQQAQRASSDRVQSNHLQVQVELQADCFAGVWANHAEAQKQFLDPGDIDAALQTVSDTREFADDKSGSTLAERIEKAGHVVAGRAIVTDDVEKIREQMRNWIADKGIDVIISTGGTGFTGRDVTPEAVEPLFEKRMDGFSTAFHMISHAKIGSSTIQSRATAGVAGSTFIFCLPGSPGACRD